MNFKTLAGPSNYSAFQNFAVLVVISEWGTGFLIPLQYYWSWSHGLWSQIPLLWSLIPYTSLRPCFSSVWLRAVFSDRFFYSEFPGVRHFLPSTARVQFFFFSYRKDLDDGRFNRVNFNSYPWRLALKSRKCCPGRSKTRFRHGLDFWMGHGSGHE